MHLAAAGVFDRWLDDSAADGPVDRNIRHLGRLRGGGIGWVRTAEADQTDFRRADVRSVSDWIRHVVPHPGSRVLFGDHAGRSDDAPRGLRPDGTKAGSRGRYILESSRTNTRPLTIFSTNLDSKSRSVVDPD